MMVMFDSLNRRMLPPYGCDWTVAPNFSRLAEHAVTFDNCYGGSMPCMPARRDFHTGRYNFLHRGWGPLEPFDESVPQILRGEGVYSHLVTDHLHYWEDGGATYHQRYSSFEFFRGQEGDLWKAHVAESRTGSPDESPRALSRRQDRINRQYYRNEDDHPQTRTFDAGLEFLEKNVDEDRWFLQIETFDPHEPFFSYADYKKYYDRGYRGPEFDWPDYKRVDEPPTMVERARDEYAALLSMCDRSLGRVLDVFDRHGLWEDTLLIVCTDHGFLLGEHGWWAKNIQPWYDETIHTPLFVWDPRANVSGVRRSALVQTMDLGPTLLEFFGIARPSRMQGASVARVIHDDTPLRIGALFGVFGGHVCLTDTRYVYMRSSRTPSNGPLYEYTLMPTQMRGFLPRSEICGASLAPASSFSAGMPTLRLPARAVSNPYTYGTLLFDLREDPGQHRPLRDDDLEQRLAGMLRDMLIVGEAPVEQFERLGLPLHGPILEEHLLIGRQWPQVLASQTRAERRRSGVDAHTGLLGVPLSELWVDPAAVSVLRQHAPLLAQGAASLGAGRLSLAQIALELPALLPAAALDRLAEQLSTLRTS